VKGADKVVILYRLSFIPAPQHGRPMMSRLLTALILPALLLCGCNGKTDSEAKTTKSSAPRKTDPKAWKPQPGSEAKITFYVKGMSEKLKLT